MLQQKSVRAIGADLGEGATHIFRAAINFVKLLVISLPDIMFGHILRVSSKIDAQLVELVIYGQIK